VPRHRLPKRSTLPGAVNVAYYATYTYYRGACGPPNPLQRPPDRQDATRRRGNPRAREKTCAHASRSSGAPLAVLT